MHIRQIGYPHGSVVDCEDDMWRTNKQGERRHIIIPCVLKAEDNSNEKNDKYHNNSYCRNYVAMFGRVEKLSNSIVESHRASSFKGKQVHHHS